VTAQKYTDCTQPGNYINLGFNAVGAGNVLAILLTFGAAAWVGVVILGGPVLISATMALVASAIVYFTWWLYGRLICLGDDPRNCAIIGVIVNHHASDPTTHGGDNDYGMNILLAPGPLDTKMSKEAYWDAPQGHLVAPNQKILDINRPYVPDGEGDVV